MKSALRQCWSIRFHQILNSGNAVNSFRPNSASAATYPAPPPRIRTGLERGRRTHLYLWNDINRRSRLTSPQQPSIIATIKERDRNPHDAHQHHGGVDRTPTHQTAVGRTMRRALLTEDLWSLPSEFRAHAQRMENILVSNQRLLENTHERLDSNQERLDSFQQLLTSSQERLDSIQEILDSNQELLKQLVAANANASSRMDRMEQDQSTIKNLTTRIQSEKYAPALAAELDLAFNRCLQPQELTEMAATAGLTGAQRRSFIQADLVILACGPGSEQDKTRYIAGEVSYTGATRDTARAMRNAAIITRVTGAPCDAALVIVRNDEDADLQVRDGLVHWYQLEERDLENTDLGGN